MFQESTYATEIQTRVADTPRRHLMRIDDFQSGRLNGRVSLFNIGTCLIIHCPYHDYRLLLIVWIRVGKFVGYQSVRLTKDQKDLFIEKIMY